LNKERQTVP